MKCIAVCLYGEYSKEHIYQYSPILKNKEYQYDLYAIVYAMPFERDLLPLPITIRECTSVIPGINHTPQYDRENWLESTFRSMCYEMIKHTNKNYDHIVIAPMRSIIFSLQPYDYIHMVSDFILEHCKKEYHISNKNDIVSRFLDCLPNTFIEFPSTKYNPSEKKEHALVIQSVIFTPIKPLDYSEVRSLFTPQERYDQTIEQLKSIYKVFPISNTDICIVEGSCIPISMILEMSKYAKIFLCRDETSKEYMEGSNKNVFECHVLGNFIEQYGCYYDRIWKFGGRYRLVPHIFSIQNLARTVPTFKIWSEEFAWTKNPIIEGIIYSIPRSFYGIFLAIYKEMLYTFQTSNKAVESELLQLLQRDKITFETTDQLGVIGRDAVGGKYRMQ